MAELPPTFTEDDGREFYVVATGHDRKGLRRLSDVLLKRLFPNQEWMHHLGDVFVRDGHTYQLLVLKATWDALYRGDRLNLQAFCDGWSEAISD